MIEIKSNLTDTAQCEYIGEVNEQILHLYEDRVEFSFKALSLEEDETLGKKEVIYDAYIIAPKKNCSATTLSWDRKNECHAVEINIAGSNSDIVYWCKSRKEAEGVHKQISDWLLNK